MPHQQTATQTIPSYNSGKLSSQPVLPKPIDQLDKVSYLFGYPIAHSLSPFLHGTVFSSLNINYGYHLFETQDISSCLAVTQMPKFFGAAVTMPFKVAIIPHLDMLTPEGEAIGAVNTIFLRNGPSGQRLLCGTNTDCIGIREAVLQNVSKEVSSGFKGRPGMIIGGGGTCRAAVYTVKNFFECSEIYLVNRDKSEVDQVIKECKSKGFGDNLRYVSTVEEAQTLAAPAVIVSAIPDFPPKSEEEIRTRAVIETFLGKEEKGVILEMCYHPSPETAIAGLAEKEGWKLVGGSEAMIWQGLEQNKIWLKKGIDALPVERVKTVINDKLAENRKANGH